MHTLLFNKKLLTFTSAAGEKYTHNIIIALGKSEAAFSSFYGK
jgi:hypothetical protein